MTHWQEMFCGTAVMLLNATAELHSSCVAGCVLFVIECAHTHAAVPSNTLYPTCRCASSVLRATPPYVHDATMPPCLL